MNLSATSRVGNLPSRALPHPFVRSSLLGLAWGVAHVLLKIPFAHESSVGLPMTLAWGVAFWAAWRGWKARWTTLLAVALGIVSCYWLAVMHVGAEISPAFLALWPQISSRRVLVVSVAYTALLCAGIAIGFANTWTARLALRNAGVSPRLTGIAVGVLLIPAGMFAFAIDHHLTPHRQVVAVAAALVPAVLLSLPLRNRLPTAKKAAMRVPGRGGRQLIMAGVVVLAFALGVAVGMTVPRGTSQHHNAGHIVPSIPDIVPNLVTDLHLNTLSTPYTDPRQLTDLPFYVSSHWLHPWRAYLDTVPASTFLDGVGMNYNADPTMNPDLVMHMLAAHGVRRIRYEIPWNQLDYATETQLVSGAFIRQLMQAARKYGIRPTILLNSNQGDPCPALLFSRTLAAPAHAGDTSVTLTDASGLVVGYSGLSNLTGYWAAEALITGISGNTVTLSKPLPASIGNGKGVIPAGTTVSMATLKYRPFSPPGTPEYAATMAGWLKYVDLVARTMAADLDTSGSADLGFDMEIWNELTFGVAFLDINNYDTLHPHAYAPGNPLNPSGIWSNLVAATATYATTHPDDFAGVQFCDGFGNTIPWPASSQEPARIAAISKHPYAGRLTYPGQLGEAGVTPSNALGRPDWRPFVPHYTALFPEYFAEGLQTETMIRDASPISSTVNGSYHGRDARLIGGKVVPSAVWISEVNIVPNENGIADSTTALALKARTSARYLAFYLNKGVTQLDFYGAAAGDTGAGMVRDNFLAYAAHANAYPRDDGPYTSPALAVIGRMAARVREGLDRSLTAATARRLQVLGIGDTHNHVQFRGDGTAAHPDLYDRDVFAFLPYQVNAHRFVIPYYVMTRDVLHVYNPHATGDRRYRMPPEQFTLQIAGLHAQGAAISAYDPINNRAVPVRVLAASPHGVTLQVTAADYPYLLTVQEHY